MFESEFEIYTMYMLVQVRQYVSFNNRKRLAKRRFQVGVGHHNIFNYLFKVKHVIEIWFNLKFMSSNNMYIKARFGLVELVIPVYGLALNLGMSS